ncbi:MAG TPA: arsenic resistance N-acetyltransferase ArsN2 [Vicinamibacterales bacterium]|nr:arsenic resistance N-acetyltransferase ArsN2 [Vicinamibacterales bacterium]
MIIGHASAEDSGVILDLLQQSQLPVDGVTHHLATTVVAREDGRIVGSATLEMYSEHALLRSLAVSPAFQSRGLGRVLTEAALAMARERHVRAVYLLTTTAEQFFPKFGFAQIPRELVPNTIHRSVEFASACPSTATVMMKTL